MPWGPADELKHPRDPTDGRWVDAVSARIEAGMGHSWPPEGMHLTGRQLASLDRQDHMQPLRGFEIWDEGQRGWRNGAHAAIILDPEDFSKRTVMVTDPTRMWGGPLVIRGDQRVPVRNYIDPTGEARPGRDRPLPDREYFHLETRRWIRGSDVDVETEDDGQVWWSTFDSRFQVDNGVVKSGTIPHRPRHHPTRLDVMMADPDHPGAHLMPAVDLLSSPSYTNGGYEILGPDGLWHIIEEVYQDDPDEEEMELIADGLHLPHLDTSEELSIRRAPPSRST